jgi:hypothetical protein
VNPELATAARRFADQNSARLAEIPAAKLFAATVVSVVAGAASDGNAVVTVRWRGKDIKVAGYGAHYTPAVGHAVTCALFDDQTRIVQRDIGQP